MKARKFNSLVGKLAVLEIVVAFVGLAAATIVAL